ncbi:MAG TPA: MMPL family transporter [Solirubrobacteraceae bacterium]|nr:MMPL family transporter [Solirubrobacteraceae bacterium]
MARRRWWVLSAWAVIIVASALAYPHLINALVAPDYSVTGSDSAQVTKLIQSNFAAAGAEQDVIVFKSDTLTASDPAYKNAVNSVLASVQGKPGVASILGPYDPAAQGQISKDGHAALASLGLNGNDSQRGGRAKSLQNDIKSAAAKTDVHAYLTGYSPSSNDITDVETADTERAESFGLPVAFIVLVLAFGAFLAGVVPLILALVSLAATMGVLSALTLVTTFDSFLLSIVTMLGVGVAIDYSLFVTTRFREELARGRAEGREDAVPNAVGIAMSTSGRTILASGIIVMISLFSLFVVSSPMFHGIAEGAVLVVLCTLFTAWTMLPALLAVLGGRVNKGSLPQRFQPAELREDKTRRPSGWAKWARTVLAHPWLGIPAALLLVLFAMPLFGIKLGIDMGLAALSEKPSGKAELILQQSFTPGVMSPVQIVATHRGSGPLTNQDLATIDKVSAAAAKDKRVAQVYSISTMLKQTQGQVSTQALARLEQDPAMKTLVEQTVNTTNGGNRTIITVIGKDPIDSTKAMNLVKDLRDRTIPAYSASAGPTMLVGGESAQFVDLANETLSKLPIVLGIVLSLTFLYLLVVFRALLIPFKAVVMNLLATAASIGLVVWVFQSGHLEGLFGFKSVGFIQSYLPIMVFAVLFGLSMDYEVFLIRRMQEKWVRTHDNEEAVVSGIAHTARPILAAAAIMTAVFGCFLVADVLELKQFGFGLAIAVLLDATVVRLLLVPAVMKVAGRANWWLPRFLDRILPRMRID